MRPFTQLPTDVCVPRSEQQQPSRFPEGDWCLSARHLLKLGIVSTHTAANVVGLLGNIVSLYFHTSRSTLLFSSEVEKLLQYLKKKKWIFISTNSHKIFHVCCCNYRATQTTKSIIPAMMFFDRLHVWLLHRTINNVYEWSKLASWTLNAKHAKASSQFRTVARLKTV